MKQKLNWPWMWQEILGVDDAYPPIQMKIDSKELSLLKDLVLYCFLFPWRIRMYAIWMVCHLPSTKSPVLWQHQSTININGSVMGLFFFSMKAQDLNIWRKVSWFDMLKHRVFFFLCLSLLHWYSFQHYKIIMIITAENCMIPAV